MNLYCGPCDRSFGSDSALQQHLRDSPMHVLSFDCQTCNRSFKSDEALQQHLRDSPVHTLLFNCTVCNRSFGSDEALQQHLQHSATHQKTPKTPLDIFFHSFPTFIYDPSLPPAISYANLEKHLNWRRGHSDSQEAWDRYQNALEEELRLWFGAENDLTAWHTLCRAIGIEPPPPSCGQCVKAVRKTHVNIIDLIEWGRKRDNAEGRVHTFPTVIKLRNYSKASRKIFHNTMRKNEEESNVVLRHLLRKFF